MSSGVKSTIAPKASYTSDWLVRSRHQARVVVNGELKVHPRHYISVPLREIEFGVFGFEVDFFGAVSG